MDRKKLEHYSLNQQYLESKIRSYKERRAAIGKLSASYEGDKVFASRKIQDKEAEELVRLMDELCGEIDKLVEEGNKEQIELFKLLDKLKNPLSKLILSKKYMDNIELDAIAKELHYSYEHTCRLHGNALAEWDKLC